VPLMGAHTAPVTAVAAGGASVAVVNHDGVSVADATTKRMGNAAAGAAANTRAGAAPAAAESSRTVPQPLTPIQPVLLGSSEAALRAQRELFAAGFCVVAIRPPTVPQGSARLRVTLSAAHTEAQVDELVETLRRVCAARDMVS
jgi:hypothetical protein